MTTGPACMQWHHGALGAYGYANLCAGGILLALALSPDRTTWVASCSDGPWQRGDFSISYTDTPEPLPSPALPALALSLRFAGPDRLVAGLADGRLATLRWPSL